MRLLIVEDEAMAANYLAQGLAESGFVADVAPTGSDGLHLALTGDYALILLDVMLPEMDGWTVFARLRAAGKETPVLFLTARDAVHDRVKGLELGADDYLVKPFAFSELLARVRNVLRRGAQLPLETLRVADLEVDILRRRATRGGRSLQLTQKEFALLAALIERPGEVVSRTELIEKIWDINFDSNTNVVEAMVRRLRAKVDQPFAVKLIHNIRGFGYALEDQG